MSKEPKDMTWDELCDSAVQHEAWRDEMLRRILLKLLKLEESLSFIYEKVQR